MAWRAFVLAHSQYGNNAYYCFFEGEDVKYYGARLDMLLGGVARQRKNFACRGKTGVVHLHRLVADRDRAVLSSCMFFVDRDFGFDTPAADSSIYVTDGYSIENHYVSPEAFGRLVAAEVDSLALANWDATHSSLVSRYRETLRTVCSEFAELNSRLAAIRRRDIAQGLEPRTLHACHMAGRTLVVATLDSVKSTLNNQRLEELLSVDPPLEAIEVEKERGDLCVDPVYLRMRGKYLLSVYVGLLGDFIKDCNDLGRYLGTRCKCKLTIQEGNSLSQLSHYADTPESLRAFIEERRKEMAQAT